MNDEQIEALRTKYGFNKIGIIEGEMYLPMKEVFEKLVQRLIPCSERLPEEYGEYLCCDKYGEYIIGFPIARVSSDDFYVETEHEIMNDCIAWMPLPELYQEEGEVHE